MRGYLKFFPVFLSFILITGSPYDSMAAGTPAPPLIMGVISDQAPPPVSVTPLGTDGLLSGMTPGNYKIPAGWSLIRAQDFEGTTPAGEYWYTSSTTDKPHSGSKSLKATYSQDQSSGRWLLDPGRVGSFTEIYLSWYEWIDSTALFNDEFFMARFNTEPFVQEVILDWYWAKDASNNPTFNGPKATLFAVSQGPRDHRHFNSSKGQAGHDSGVTDYIPKGAWVQWEIYYRPNTPTDPSVAVSDGFMRVYKNGVLFAYAEQANLNGTTSMNNAQVAIGGIYTKLVWMTDYPTCTACSSRPGDGTDACWRSMNWIGQPFSKPICAPIDPPLPSFNRFIDDIILIKR